MLYTQYRVNCCCLNYCLLARGRVSRSQLSEYFCAVWFPRVIIIYFSVQSFAASSSKIRFTNVPAVPQVGNYSFGAVLYWQKSGGICNTILLVFSATSVLEALNFGALYIRQQVIEKIAAGNPDLKRHMNHSRSDVENASENPNSFSPESCA